VKSRCKFCWVQQWKNFKNRPTKLKVMNEYRVARYYWPRVSAALLSFALSSTSSALHDVSVCSQSPDRTHATALYLLDSQHQCFSRMTLDFVLRGVVLYANCHPESRLSGSAAPHFLPCDAMLRRISAAVCRGAMSVTFVYCVEASKHS